MACLDSCQDRRLTLPWEYFMFARYSGTTPAGSTVLLIKRRGSRQTQGRRTRLRLSQAIPCQPGLCTQPTERLIRNILQAGVEEGIMLPRFLTTGLQSGNDSPEDRGQIHAMSAVAQSIEDVLMFSCASHGRGFIDGPVNHSIPA